MPTDREIQESIYSDLYKDVFGVRPTKSLSEHTDEELSQMMNHLSHQNSERINLEAMRQQENLRNFQADIREMHKLGASNIREAIKWILDAEGLLDHPYGVEHINWEMNLPHAHEYEVYFRKILLEKF